MHGLAFPFHNATTRETVNDVVVHACKQRLRTHTRTLPVHTCPVAEVAKLSLSSETEACPVSNSALRRSAALPPPTPFSRCRSRPWVQTYCRKPVCFMPPAEGRGRWFGDLPACGKDQYGRISAGYGRELQYRVESRFFP